MAEGWPIPSALVVVLLSFSAWATHSCPASCSCPKGQDEVHILDCNRRRLSSVPLDPPDGITQVWVPDLLWTLVYWTAWKSILFKLLFVWPGAQNKQIKHVLAVFKSPEYHPPKYYLLKHDRVVLLDKSRTSHEYREKQRSGHLLRKTQLLPHWIFNSLC